MIQIHANTNKNISYTCLWSYIVFVQLCFKDRASVWRETSPCNCNCRGRRAGFFLLKELFWRCQAEMLSFSRLGCTICTIICTICTMCLMCIPPWIAHVGRNINLRILAKSSSGGKVYFWFSSMVKSISRQPGWQVQQRQVQQRQKARILFLCWSVFSEHFFLPHFFHN